MRDGSYVPSVVIDRSTTNTSTRQIATTPSGETQGDERHADHSDEDQRESP
jgi:hypothetical protein